MPAKRKLVQKGRNTSRKKLLPGKRRAMRGAIEKKIRADVKELLETESPENVKPKARHKFVHEGWTEPRLQLLGFTKKEIEYLRPYKENMEKANTEIMGRKVL